MANQLLKHEKEKAENKLSHINTALGLLCESLRKELVGKLALVSVISADPYKSYKFKLVCLNLTQDSFAKNFTQEYLELFQQLRGNSTYKYCFDKKLQCEDQLNNENNPETALFLKACFSCRILIPLIQGDKVLGIVELALKKAKNLELDPAQSQSLKNTVQQITIALEQLQEFNLAKQQAETSLLITKLVSEMNKSQNIDQIVNSTVISLGELMDCDRCFFAGINNTQWLIQAEYTSSGVEELMKNQHYMLFETSVIEDFVKQGYSFANNIEFDLLKESQKDIYEFYKSIDVKSFIYIPIKLKDKICGILGLNQNYPRNWDNKEIELLEIVGNQVSSSITQAQLINDLRSSNERLLELDKLKSQLMSTVSHELRTPMANILGFSELLLHREFSHETSKQYLSEIYSASTRLSNLIQDFLDLSRIEATGKVPLNPFEETEIDWIAKNAWKQVSAQNPDFEIEWFKASAALPHIQADSDAMTRVFTNLFSNAVKYSGTSKKVFCQMEANKNNLFVCIEDKGIGIPEDKVNAIFDKFFRVDNSTTRSIGGTGLGLSICKEIITAHHGQIWCESKLGEGSKISFILPIRTGPQNENQHEAQIWLN